MPIPHAGLQRAFSEQDVAAILAFSRQTWLPDLNSAFHELARAIREGNVRAVSLKTNRVRDCAAVGGAHEIIATMNEIDSLAKSGQWLSVRSRFRDANHLLAGLIQWVARTDTRLAS